MPRRSTLTVLLALMVARLGADAPPSDPRSAILIEAVEAAATLDFWHARCRGDVSGRHTDNLNKLLVGRQRTTVLRVQDELFPERGYRRVQQRLETAHQTLLNAAGGCQAARQTDLPERLRGRYEAAMDAVRTLP